MRPLLLVLNDGQAWRTRDLYARLAAEFSLGDAELAEMLPGGRQPTSMNRIGWAKTYLLKAGAVRSPQRGTVGIAPRGRDLLAAHPEGVTTRQLYASPEFARFQGTARSEVEIPAAAHEAPRTLSPEEQFSALHAELNAGLADELLAQVQPPTPLQAGVCSACTGCSGSGRASLGAAGVRPSSASTCAGVRAQPSAKRVAKRAPPSA